MSDEEYTYIRTHILDHLHHFDKGATMPYDTGNLVLNAIKIEELAYGAFQVYVNSFGKHVPESRDGIAPYFKKVNYFDTINGKPNKHYHWWDNAIADEVKNIAKYLGGRVEET